MSMIFLVFWRASTRSAVGAWIVGLSLCGLLLISGCATLPEPAAEAPPAVPEPSAVPDAAPAALEPPASAASAPPPVPAEDAPAAPLESKPSASEHTVPSLMDVPDAKPQIESIPRGGPNSPYQLKGQCYAPMGAQSAYKQRGLASWYGPGFHGKRTANGEVYNMYGMTAAHKTLPIPSYVRVRNPANRREVLLRVNDRGPFHHSRLIDLSYTAALKLGLVDKIAPVEIERITSNQIRQGVRHAGERSRAEVSDATDAQQGCRARRAC
jgi:rare lipoprotein A (peptidoglycan hydrolase)